MKHYLKLNLKMLLEHFIVQTISFVLVIFGFLFFMQYNFGRVVLCIMMVCFYLVWMYSKAKSNGEKDSRSYSENKPHYFNGLVSCGLIFLVCIAFWMFYAMNAGQTDGVGITARFLLRFWSFYISAIFDAGGGYETAFYILMFVIPMLSSTLGYIAGMKRIDILSKLTEKIVYKK